MKGSGSSNGALTLNDMVVLWPVGSNKPYMFGDSEENCLFALVLAQSPPKAEPHVGFSLFFIHDRLLDIWGLSTHVAAWLMQEASEITEAKGVVMVEQIRGGLLACLLSGGAHRHYCHGFSITLRHCLPGVLL